MGRMAVIAWVLAALAYLVTWVVLINWMADALSS